MKLEAIKAALKQRGLDTKGRKAELEERLKADDERVKESIFSRIADTTADSDSDDGVVTVRTPHQRRARSPKTITLRSKTNKKGKRKRRVDPDDLENASSAYRGHIISVIVFAILYAILHIVFPAVMQWPVSLPYTDVNLLFLADICDIAGTPIILCAYWVLLDRLGDGEKLKDYISIMFIQLASIWATGHGIQIAGNFISRSLLTFNFTLNATVQDLFVQFGLFARIGPILRQGSGILLAALITLVQAQHPFELSVVPNGPMYGLTTSLLVIFGCLHGFELFVVNVGHTSMLLPILAIMVISVIFIKVIPHGISFRRVPMVVYMTAASLSSIALAAIWGYMNGGELPDFM